jgi:hypothetical protein
LRKIARIAKEFITSSDIHGGNFRFAHGPICAAWRTVNSDPRLGDPIDAPRRTSGDSRFNRMFKWLGDLFSIAEEDFDNLGTEEGLETFIALLPRTAPANTIEAVSEQFENARILDLESGKLMRALKRLDEHAQDPLAVLSIKLFEDKLGRQLSDPVWLAMARFYRNVYTGYRVCLEAVSSRGKESDGERNDAALIACRAMAALGRHKTLLRMRYREIDLKFWEDTIELAAWCANRGCANTLLELYPNSQYHTTFEREYLIALLFEAAPGANLNPAQMIALEIILRRFAANYLFWNEYSDSTPFVFDLQGETIAKRWMKGMGPSAGMKFFGVADAYSQVVGLNNQAKTSREIPEWLLGARLDVESYRGLLDLLVSHWSGNPPQRRHRRDQSQGELRVVHGIGQVRRMIAASEYVKAGGRLDYEESTPYDFKVFGRVRFGNVTEEATKEDRAAQDLLASKNMRKFEFGNEGQVTEGWTVINVSASGLGAVANVHDGWARIGMLVGVRRGEGVEWQLAIVRRLSRSLTGRLSVGMTTIPGTAYSAQIRIPENDSKHWVPLVESADVKHDAILVQHGKSTSLFMAPGIFTDQIECKISFAKRWRSVKLEGSLGLGYDFEQVAVTIFG